MNNQRIEKFKTISRRPKTFLSKPIKYSIKPDQYYNEEKTTIVGLGNNSSLELIPEIEFESVNSDSGNEEEGEEYEDEKSSYFLSSLNSSSSEDDSMVEISSKLEAYLNKIEKLKTLLNTNFHDKPDPLEQLLELTTRHQAGLNGVIQSQIENLSSKERVLKDYNKSLLRRDQRVRDDVLSSGDEQDSYASSSNEAAHLQQRLKNLSSELVTLRNRLNPNNNNPNSLHLSGPNSQAHPPSPPLIPPPNRGGRISFGYPNKPLPPNPPSSVTASSLSNVSTTQGSCYLTVPVHGNFGHLQQDPSAGYYANQEIATKELNSPGNPYATTYDTKPSSASLIIGTDAGGSTRSVSSSSSIQMSNKSCTSSIGGHRAVNTEPSLPIKNCRQQLASTNNSNTRPITIPLAEIEDCIHLPGPLTEDALIRCLQARCANAKHYVYMGPILLLANPFSSVGNSLTISSTETHPIPLPIQKIVNEALRQQTETGYPQAIILNGCSGSGKTYSSMLVLRHLFEATAGSGIGSVGGMNGVGTESDAYKHLTTSITVLRSLGTARTLANAESSRIGHFIEVQVTDGSLYRTKVHCYFLDQNRVVKTKPNESNYHIFYQLLAGLGKEERAKLHLGEHTIKTLRYLNNYHQNDNAEDARRFMEWKTCLSLLGIPFLDVVRVLCAVLLIGNVQFLNPASATSPTELEIEGSAELQAVASLLGVSESALRQGLTTRTHNNRNQLIRSHCDANLSNFSRDSLAKSLYCRTVATIVRRANSLKRLNTINHNNPHNNNKNIVGSSAGTLTSSDSADSINNQNNNNCQFEVSSQHASTVGTAGSKASKSMTALNNAVRHATDGFIGVLDLFGFEEIKQSQLEHLCINLCAETMQHFYNTHIFKACIESCREENIQCDWEVDLHYHDNVPCIDLISSLRTGLLSMLDVECSTRGTVESYVQKIRSQHSSNPRLLLQDTNSSNKSIESSYRSTFGIQHYGGKVHYDASDFLDTNRDVLPDDLVAVFHKHRCSFGFASHLFSSELKVLGGSGSMEPCPKGISFRISPTSHTDLLNGDEPVSTLTQDFHTRLDNLLRTLVHAKPHFIRCIKINQSEQRNLFDRHTVSKQLRSFQVLETVNLMAHGYPHRMRFKTFNSRFKLLAGSSSRFTSSSARMDENSRFIDEAKFILEEFDLAVSKIRKLGASGSTGQISMGWAIGKKHVFLSEGARQELENLRNSKRNQAATLIQSTWRGWYCRRRWPIVRQSVQQHFQLKSLRMGSSANDMTMGNYMNAPDCNSIGSNGKGPPHPQAMTNFGNFQMESNSSPPHSIVQFQQPIQVSQLVPAGTSIHRSSASASIITTNNNNYKNVYPASQSLISMPIGDKTNRGNLDPIGNSNRPRPQPISGTPPPDVMDSSTKDSPVQNSSPPPIPPSRSYTIVDGDISSEIRLLKGENVRIVGSSPRRGHLIVDHRHRTLHVPFQYLELKI